MRALLGILISAFAVQAAPDSKPRSHRRRIRAWRPSRNSSNSGWAVGPDMAGREGGRSRSRHQQRAESTRRLRDPGEFLRRRWHAPTRQDPLDFRHGFRQMEANLARQRWRLSELYL